MARRKRNPDGDPREQDRQDAVEDLPLFSSDQKTNAIIAKVLGPGGPAVKDLPPFSSDEKTNAIIAKVLGPGGPAADGQRGTGAGQARAAAKPAPSPEGAGYVPYADPRTSPETSLEAAAHQAGTGKAETDRQRVWEAILDEPDTDDGLEVRLGLPHQTVSARRRGLVLEGWIRDSGRKDTTRSGRRAAIWEPVPLAERPTGKATPAPAPAAAIDPAAPLPPRSIPPKGGGSVRDVDSEVANMTGSTTNKLAPKLIP